MTQHEEAAPDLREQPIEPTGIRAEQAIDNTDWPTLPQLSDVLPPTPATSDQAVPMWRYQSRHVGGDTPVPQPRSLPAGGVSRWKRAFLVATVSAAVVSGWWYLSIEHHPNSPTIGIESTTTGQRTITVQLLGPLQPPVDGDCNDVVDWSEAPVAAQWKLPLKADGTYDRPTVSGINSQGCYLWRP